MSIYVDTVKVTFLLGQLYSSAVALEATMMALGPSKVVEERESGDGEVDIEEV